MTIPALADWDETSPAGNSNIALGDNRIRELKTQIREVVGVDHDFPSSGSATDNGQHKRVTLQEQGDLGTGAVGATILGSQTINLKGELVYTDEDDNDIQLTKAGKAYPSQSTTLADWSTILNLVYPVGYVITLGVATNPGTLLGVGTWTAITGKVIVGKDSGTFSTLDATGGAETVTLTAAQSGVPAHTHDTATSNTTVGGSSLIASYTSRSVDTTISGGTSGVKLNTAASASSSHTNLQPYIVKYVWQRTA